MEYLHEIIHWWNAVFFAPTNTLTASVLRLLIGGLMIIDSVYWWRLSKLLLAPDGWYSYTDYKEDKEKYFYFSLVKYLPKTTRSVNVIIALQGIAAVCILLGFYSNIAAVVCFATLVSIHNRNLYVINSGDTVRRFLVLFLIFAPGDAQLSIRNAAHLLDAQAQSWPTAVVMLNLFAANIYFKNTFYKLQGKSWRNGTATKLALGVRILRHFKLPAILDKTWFYAATTYGTLVIEAALFTLIWFDALRVPVLIGGFALHIGMGLFLRLPMFQLSMLILLCSFIKPEEYLAIFSFFTK